MIQPSHSRIFKCMLLTKGPITTLRSLRNIYDDFKHFTRQEFIQFARLLETANLGRYIIMDKLDIFVKSDPSTAHQVLQDPKLVDNLGLPYGSETSLCSFGEYADRFHLPVPSYYVTSKSVLEQLVIQGVVTSVK